MHIALIEPYLAGSHEAWARGYIAHSRHRVSLLSLPGHFWKWRMHGGAVALATPLRELLLSDEPPELLLASDMIDVTTLLALTRDVAARLPVALYFHENQLTYPPPPGSRRDLHYGWINYVSSLASDTVFFNSQHHLEEWYDELPRLLKHFPDHVPLHTLAPLRARSEVLPPGVALRPLDAPAASDLPLRGSVGVPPLILWNHRWEFDKAPDAAFGLLARLDEEGVPFRLAIAGESFRAQPSEFLAARERLGARIVHFGYASREAYRALLQRADIVISTAIHEFFGIATVEAIYAGCAPLLPARLAYPELIPAAAHERFLYRTLDEAHAMLARWLTEGIPEGDLLRRHAARYDWATMAARYDDRFEAMVQRP